MSVLALGLNHVTAPLAIRERFAFAGNALGPAARALAQCFRSDPEVAIVSTCNRTELYLGADADAVGPAMHWLAEAGGTDREHLARHTYVLADEAAARHAFRVAAGSIRWSSASRRSSDSSSTRCARPRTRARSAARCIRCSSARSPSRSRCAARLRSARSR